MKLCVSGAVAIARVSDAGTVLANLERVHRPALSDVAGTAVAVVEGNTRTGWPMMQENAMALVGFLPSWGYHVPM